MNDVTRHPDDEVLFDLANGALDDGTTDLARRHIARCAACAAFVRAATDGAAALVEAVEPMPEQSAQSMHLSINAAWRERRDSIAADEQSTPVSVNADVALAPLDPEAEPIPLPRRRRARRLLPVLAFAVLATLAGTSVYIGQQTSDDQSVATTTSDSTDAERAAPALSDAIDHAAAPAAGAADTEGAAAPDGIAKSTGTDAAAAPENSVPADEPYDNFIANDIRCVATRDETELSLPDGRIPQQIIQGPLGIYVVCG
jgi:hypothetical protein